MNPGGKGSSQEARIDVCEDARKPWCWSLVRKEKSDRSEIR
jgi:hypothetical protein